MIQKAMVRPTIALKKRRQATNLPRSVSKMEMGEVIKSSMVPVFFSSAYRRIVSMGMMKSEMKLITPKSWLTTNSLRFRLGSCEPKRCACWEY